MRKVATILLLPVILVTCIGCDQITKDLARDHLTYGEPLTVVGDLIHLVYAENPGIAFGIGSGLSTTVRFWLFTVGILAILCFIAAVAYHRRNQGPLFLAGITLVLAGGTSNLIDRLTNDGRVVDFVVLAVGEMRTIVFNLADVLVVAGAALLIFGAFRTVQQERRMATASIGTEAQHGCDPMD